jgi:hypothetical protein
MIMFGMRDKSDSSAKALTAAAKAVRTQADFVQFAQLLARNLKHHRSEWENDRLDHFVEALSRYANDVGGYYRNIGEERDLANPDWSVFATILMGAKVYE